MISNGTTLATLEPLYEDVLAACAVRSVAQEKDEDRNKMLDRYWGSTQHNEKDTFFFNALNIFRHFRRYKIRSRPDEII